jgi:HSP20 family protein
MDLSETDKEIEITAELPGLEEKDIQLNVADNVLTIRGERRTSATKPRRTIILSNEAMVRSPEPSSCRTA